MRAQVQVLAFDPIISTLERGMDLFGNHSFVTGIAISIDVLCAGSDKWRYHKSQIDPSNVSQLRVT